MMSVLARTLITVAAMLAPRHMRARWREEWLAEISAAQSSRLRLISRAFGAPIDALLLHWTPSTNMSVRNGWTADLRDAWRALAKTPLQTATMIGCLAVGSALFVTVAAILNSLTWGDAPGVSHQSRLVRILATPSSGRPAYNLKPSDADAADWDSVRETIEVAGSRVAASFKVSVSGELHAIRGSFISGTYFHVLGTTASAGRLVTPPDDRLDAPAVAVISHAVWQQRFGGDPAAIGRVFLVDQRPVEIVGVTPPGFVDMDLGDLGETADAREHIWLPRALAHAWRRGTAPGATMYVARLAGGISRQEAEAAVQGLIPGLRVGEKDAPGRLALRPYRLLPVEGMELIPAFAMMLAVPVIVLILGCANTASLQAARTSRRLHELAVRTSIGATRLRLTRLLSIEIFFTASAATGLAWLIMAVALSYSASVLPFVVRPDWRVFLVAVSLPALLTLVAGCLPSWRASGIDVVKGLCYGGRTQSAGIGRIRRVLVAGQVALSVVLVLGALLIARAISSGPLSATAGGKDVVVAGLHVFEGADSSGERRGAVAAFVREVHALADPGSVALSTGGLRRPSSVRIGPRQEGPWTPRRARQWSEAHIVTPAFFDIMRVRLLHGRLFGEREPGVMVVNESFARRFAPGGDILGDAFDVASAGLGMDPSLPEGTVVKRRVIGVVPDGYERFSPGDEPRAPMIYLPLDARRMSSVGVYVRTADAEAVQARLRVLAGALHPPAVLRPLDTADAIIAEPYEPLIWLARALTAASLLALALAAIGLFALIASSVAQRIPEFGVRYALGATRAQVIGLVIREISRTVSAGFGAGILLVLPIWGLIRDEILRHAAPVDPIAMASGLAMFVGVMALAAYLPARRAARMDPLAALRVAG